MRKKLIYLVCSLLVLGLGVIQVDSAQAARIKTIGSICKSITTLPNGGYIYKTEAPLRSPSTNRIVGKRREPTLIMNGRGGSRSGTTIYDSNGTSIGSCPWASAHGHAGGRYRCTMNTNTLVSKARKNTKSRTGYFKLNGNSCVKIPDLGTCYGSRNC